MDNQGIPMKTWILVASGLFAIGGAIAANMTEPKAKATVIYFLSTDCPVAMQYTPRINRLEDKFQDVQFKALFPNDLETKSGIAKYMREREYGFAADLDLGAAEAKRLGVTTVPSAVVLDPNGKVLYVGAIDDSKDVTFVKRTYLQDALEAVTNGKAPATKKAPAFGCLVMPGEAPPARAKVNYAEHIAGILQDHCVDCHRPGEVAPFSLQGYANAKKWAPMINLVTEKKQMPPWKAVAGHGEFMDENRLTETELATLKNWKEAGCPEGDQKKAPKPRTYSGAWALGQPDIEMMPKADFQLGAEGSDEYRNFVVHKNTSGADQWVTAMDVRPGNRQVVHHVIAFIDTTGTAEKKEAQNKDGRPGYDTFGGPGFIPSGSLGGWAPGLRPRKTHGDTAFRVPNNASIVMQVHYHRNGKQETDRTKLGIYLAKETPKQELRLRWLANPMFRLAPGDKEAKVKLDFRTPVDITVHGVMPHMHLLGRSMKAQVRFPDGKVEPLIFIEDWDFNWQMAYVLKEPMRLPAGSTIMVEGVYDNSAENPRNPNNPPKPVTWGEQTTDEMFLLVVPYTVDGEIIKK